MEVEDAISTPDSGSCSSSTPSSVASTVVRRTSPRKRKQPEESPLASSDSSITNKRVCLFKEVPKTTKDGKYWLEKFEIPSKWEPAVQAALDKGDLTVEHKNALNRQLCSAIIAFTDTVSKAEREHIAVQLIKKYPFLKGTVGAGHSFWAKKMKDRFENVNKKRNKDLKKKGRKKKVSHPAAVVPAIPEGVTSETYHEQIKSIQNEWKKPKRDYNIQRELMASTHAMQRREILTQNVRVWRLMQD